jgi:hypothetical protein
LQWGEQSVKRVVAPCITAVVLLAMALPVASAAPARLLWTAQHSPTAADLADISCASPSDCLAVGSHATIVKTENRGRSWAAVSTPYGKAHPAASFVSVRCPAIGVCWVLAAPNVVLRTIDAGRTWQAHTFALRVLQDGYYVSGLTRLACPTRQICYATAPPLDYLSTYFARSAVVFKTSDGNRTWQYLGIPLSVPCPGGSCPSQERPGLQYEGVGYVLQWISCQSALSCRAGGDTFIGSHQGFAGAVIRTDNGGRTWTLMHSGLDANVGTCPTTSICTGVFYQPDSPNHDIDLMRSTDGGLSWSSTSISTALTSIACAGPTFCELAGPHGALAMAIARRVFVQRSPTRRDLSAVACPRMDACYAVGAGGTILARTR